MSPISKKVGWFLVRVAVQTLAFTLVLTAWEARAQERTDCEVQADYALYVAQERDKGTPMADLLQRASGTAPEKVWARMTVTNIYGSQLVTPRRVKELYMVRCEQ